MRVYFSGLGGVGIGPLAEIACDAGYDVLGSDLNDSPMTKQLRDRGVQVYIGQDGSALAAAHAEQPIDWLVHTSALPDDHPELEFARSHSFRISKRDEFLASFIHEKSLKLIAIAGTHGKTTTTGLLIYAMKQLQIPISYSIGTTISFGPSGLFDHASEYFLYECDEYDHNFLHFEPYLSIITALDYDHVDTYTTVESYKKAFIYFLQQSTYSLLWGKDLHYLGENLPADLSAYNESMSLSHISLPGQHVRQNAFLVEQALKRLLVDQATPIESTAQSHTTLERDIIDAINDFPGTARRFEKLADNLYSDYGHHPTEIAATLQMAHELADHVALVYQPHQNVRQHQIRGDYTDEVFMNASDVYWLPTYLSREDPALEILTPQQLSSRIMTDKVHAAEMDDELWDTICRHRDAGHLVLVMGAGSIDNWIRQQLDIKQSAEILLIDQNGNFVMQHRDNKPDINNPGMLTSFGGTVELNETTRLAAVRELSEETNLTFSTDQLHYLATIFQAKTLDGTSRWVTYYVLTNVSTDRLIVFEGQGYKIVHTDDRDSYPLSEMAQKATSLYLRTK